MRRLAIAATLAVAVTASAWMLEQPKTQTAVAGAQAPTTATQAQPCVRSAARASGPF
jgi:hypothetical protein